MGLVDHAVSMRRVQCDLSDLGSRLVLREVWRSARCRGPSLFRRGDIATDRRSLWRYQKAVVHQGPVTVSLGEGWTPLVSSHWNSTAIQWKCEFVSISGSFKDRGVSVMINNLLANGVMKVAERFIRQWRCCCCNLCGCCGAAVPYIRTGSYIASQNRTDCGEWRGSDADHWQPPSRCRCGHGGHIGLFLREPQLGPGVSRWHQDCGL